MSIRSSNYGGMDWVDALKGRKERRNYETRYASTDEKDAIDDALAQTVEAVFKVPTKEETSEEAVRRMSKDIQAEAAQQAAQAEIAAIKDKLAATEDRPAIDPVGLGIEIKVWDPHKGMETRAITKEEWANISDPRCAEEIAKASVLRMREVMARSWERKAYEEYLASQTPGSRPDRIRQKFDPEVDRHGRVAAGHGVDDHAPRFGRVPENANSISDPGRLDRMAQQQTDHDRMVAESRAAQKAREQKAHLHRAQEREDSGHAPIHNTGSAKVMHSGSHETEAFIQRVPRNQFSMTDNFGADFDSLSQEEKTARLESIFMEKFKDPTDEERGIKDIKEYNEERRASIQRPNTLSRQQRREQWLEDKKDETPLSTSDIQRRLTKLWMPEEPGK